ncbi:MAG: TIGR02452 family protein [Candidatus Paracaedimonas acanthamoebae]|uniref:TIGR02452 family protein n=1 Tax=Candidatus Paracaedimonas acanthamoebae TaxID=244581 RepID=A0A8J7PSD4_9PROT|nr:TIGR02452 family protein [Candidatus Paracaedimonas acanthamoebae]
MRKMKSLLLMTISAATFQNSCLASPIYNVDTEIDDSTPHSGNARNSAQPFLETMVPPPPKVFDPHGTLLRPEGAPYNIVGTPMDVEPQLQSAPSRRLQLGQKKPSAPSSIAQPAAPSFEPLPPAYTPYVAPSPQQYYGKPQQYGNSSAAAYAPRTDAPYAAPSYSPHQEQRHPQNYQHDAPLGHFPQAPQNQAYDRHRQNYQQASSSHSAAQEQRDYQHAQPPHQQYGAASYSAAAQHDYVDPKLPHSVTPSSQKLPYGVSYPPASKPQDITLSPVNRFTPGITPPPPVKKRTFFKDVAHLFADAPSKKTAAVLPNIEDSKKSSSSSQSLRTEYELSTAEKRQAALDAYDSTKKLSYIYSSGSSDTEVKLIEAGKPLDFYHGFLSTVKFVPLFKTSIVYANQPAQMAALQLSAEKGTKVGILNFANSTHPGGGAFYGASGQEESLIRTTTLFSSLSQVIDPTIDLAQQLTQTYPAINYNEITNSILEKLNGILISQDVSLFRIFFKGTYQNLEKPRMITILTSAAPNLNKPKPENYEEIIRQRVYSQLAGFSLKKIDSIILGAWGCGAFRNDPSYIASVYKSLLENEFKGMFKNVVFAIPNAELLKTFQLNGPTIVKEE